MSEKPESIRKEEVFKKIQEEILLLDLLQAFSRIAEEHQEKYLCARAFDAIMKAKMRLEALEASL